MPQENSSAFTVNFEPKKVFDILLSVNEDKINYFKKSEKSIKKRLHKITFNKEMHQDYKKRIKQLLESYNTNGKFTDEELIYFEKFKKEFGLKSPQ